MNQKTIEQLNNKSKFAPNNRDYILLNDFNLLLTKNIKCARSVKYYAEQLATSTKKLNYLTKTYYGRTAKEYIEEKIIFDSKELLINTHSTVKQISYSMGFTEPTNFNKFFKKNTSTTPLQFRVQHNKGAF